MQKIPRITALYTSIGMALAIIFSCIATLGFPKFYVSFWNAEPIALGMYVICSFIALWLLIGTFLGVISFSFPKGNPLVYLWCAWIVWQAICTLFADNPWRSWFGPPEQTEGLAWYTCASIFIIQLSVLWSHAKFRALLLSISFLLMVILGILHFISDEKSNLLSGFVFEHFSGHDFKSLLPFVWPDYLGSMAACWWLALMLTYPQLSLRLMGILTCIIAIVLITSSNQTALILVGYAMLLTLTIKIMQTLKLGHFTDVSATWRKLAMIALCLPLGWLLAAPYLPAHYSTTESQSLPTRIMMNHIALKTIVDEPQRLLIGNGWGQFEDDFFKHALIRDVSVYTQGKHQPNWPLIRGYNYHTHNMPSETLLSLGLIGFLLWFIFPIVALKYLPDRLFWQACPMLIALYILQHVWFALPQGLPLRALCWFLLMRCVLTTAFFVIPRRVVIAGLSVIAIALSWSAVQQYQAIRYDMQMTDPFGERYGSAVTQSFMEQDIKRGGDRLRAFFISTTKRMVQNQSHITPKHIALYTQYLGAMEEMSRTAHIGAYNGQAVLYGYNVLLSSLRGPLIEPLLVRMHKHYPEIAKQHTLRAPWREDVIAPYLQALYRSPQDIGHQQLMQLLQELLAIHPTHRSALWLAGKIMAETPDFESQGHEMMRLAIKLGAARIFLIKDEEIEQLP